MCMSDDGFHIMERRQTILMLLLLGGGIYAGYDNWDVINDKLGLDEINPGKLKAIELTKNERTFERGISNWQYVASAADRGEITIGKKPWQAKQTGDQEFTVVARWIEDEQSIAHKFQVNIARRIVRYKGAAEQAAAPR
ncbi:MAG: hypothetical protein ACI89X_001339 [Planctomycetota bacterium]|jgi:hypothetical protein